MAATSPRSRRGALIAVVVGYAMAALITVGAIATQWGSTDRIDQFSDVIEVPSDPEKPRDDERTVRLAIELTDFDTETSELSMTLEVREPYVGEKLPREDIVLWTSYGELTLPLLDSSGESPSGKNAT